MVAARFGVAAPCPAPNTYLWDSAISQVWVGTAMAAAVLLPSKALLLWLLSVGSVDLQGLGSVQTATRKGGGGEGLIFKGNTVEGLTAPSWAWFVLCSQRAAEWLTAAQQPA